MTIQNVNQSFNTTANIGIKPAEKKPTESAKQEDKQMSKATKLFIGAAALSAAVVGGIMAHKNIAANNAIKEEIASLEGVINRVISGIEHYSPEPLAARMEEISKLKGQERLKALKGLNSTISDATSLHNNISLAQKGGATPVLKKGMSGLPEDVKAAYESKDALKTMELYEAHLAKIPDTYKPVNRGATVAETIENTFGKNSSIKPHTYDLSQENPTLHVYRNAGGYKDGVISKEGIFHRGYGGDSDLIAASVHGFAKKSNGGNGFNVTSGSLSELQGIQKKGLANQDRKVVRFTFATGQNDTVGNDIPAIITVISPNNKFTPFQKDLLKLAENPEKYDASAIQKITEVVVGATGREGIGKLAHGQLYENCDYDLLLSAFQSMVK